MRKSRRFILFLLTASVVLSLFFYLKNPQPTAKKETSLLQTTLGLSWIHSAQFVGAYYADQQGLYQQEGLDVTLIPGGIDRDPLGDLLAGKTDFVVAQPDSLATARASGAQVKAIAAIYRIHPLVFISLSERRIIKPQDLTGKRVGVAYSEGLILRALLTRLNVSEVQVLSRSYGLQDLESGALDVQGAWLDDEVQSAKRKNLSLNIIAPSDYGIIFYADVLATTEQLIHQDPQRVERFLKATLQGWSQAIEDPENHAQLVLRYDPQRETQHDRDLMESSMPLINTGDDPIGWMNAEHWESMLRTMTEQGLIQAPLAPEDLYTMRFLNQIYHR